jgi:aryl-alcohol dehydrogenase-like predicted oxidoreductase
MRMRFLGKTGLQVSELCLGTANFGATGVYLQSGEITQKEADKIVGTALDSGLNFFNTAERYSYGRAEEFFGKALGSRRQEAIIIDKINPARKPGPNDGGLSRKHIIEGCEASLKRLGTDYVDIYEMHEFDTCTPLETSLRAMDDLVSQGKVRYFGCSNFTAWQLMKGMSISERNGWDKFVTLESMYSLCNRWLEYEVIPACLEHGISLLVWSPLHGGYLSGKYRRGKPLPAGTRFGNLEDKFWPVEQQTLFDIVDELASIAKVHKATVSQAALNYLLCKPAVTSLIIGIRTIDQLKENLKFADWQMAPEEVAKLDKISELPHMYPYFVYDPEYDIYVKH